MLKRTIYIGNAAYLSCKLKQMVIKLPEVEKNDDIPNHLKQKSTAQIPIEDIGILLLDHSQITITHTLIQVLQQNKAVIISCNSQHIPSSFMLPTDGHTELTERWHKQLSVSEPLKKQLWKQTVIAKISNQSALLKQYNKDFNPMEEYKSKVISGDVTNMEGKAANHYWKHILNDFVRDRDGKYPNNLLNFGYALLRAIVARAIVSSGLLLTVGIFHKNKYNPFCLADDIMEPYRSYIDKLVVEWEAMYPDFTTLTKECKAYLMQIATVDTCINGKLRPLMVAVSITTASLYKCFIGEKRNIIYPQL